MKTSIIVPVIRPDKAQRCIELAQKNAGIPAEDYEILYFVDHQRIGAPKMVKALTAIAKYDTVAFIGDDCLPQKDWLKNAQLAMEKFYRKWCLVGLNDETGRVDLATHWLAHKRLLEHLDGEFFHTGYWHVCCDVELTERAKKISRFVYAEDAKVLHDHPLLKGEETDDEDYKRVYSDEYLSHDRNLLKLRRDNNWED